ncbi:LOW QUALITY PROTEIN: aluminum-activated malate transporter 10-like [Pyrus x bretschneideri]|uniref:LOW QUALITY PROTEIN: aluminum-activated malate transporter 10-like n=1 Tax=Pyrus x bretschneideri TaxID=225117 RepID=UPI00202F5596|nr:LOW QUALITY PROTEIN: aluminum-activated malate transporter 10-like [Pyrus x bretschneideri]
MAQEKEATGAIEWRIKMADGSSESLAPTEARGCPDIAWLALKGLVVGLVMKVCDFLKKAWDLGHNEPIKVIHGVKVGMALTAVSLFYYMRPLYEGVGGNAMWAVMTVVVVFENTVGATLSKSINRICGTLLAGFLAIGIHWIADRSGKDFEPFIIAFSVFLLASAATFSRFIPSVKARFDYGAMIFILTFSLVSVSGYRVDELFDLATQRMSTIIIGTCLCIVITMIICPIWAGEQLHTLITGNMDKLANSLDGCVADYFNDSGDFAGSDKESDKKLLGYKCVLVSKATEESMANFARWELAHGRFNFRHPWKQYLKIGASMRNCAYCIEALNGCVSSENEVSELTKKHISNIAIKVSSRSSIVIKELARTMKTTKKSSAIDLLVGEMNNAVLELQEDLKSLPNLFINPKPLLQEPECPENNTTTKAEAEATALMDIIPLVTLASLLIEIVARVEGMVSAVEELAKLAEFKAVGAEKANQNQTSNKIVPNQSAHQRV